ncbi:hypothetical protein F5878DRAFT_42477 [Lentinula raphanica]|uniref:Uncharacterized protein n=1 Tax=Lentinula raphanica TaxID=153919 RepID=A0AA38UGU6_9AGAR|nr:hypothetical protein F5878DRAFT_42477 [Lentinula raphanica]
MPQCSQANDEVDQYVMADYMHERNSSPSQAHFTSSMNLCMLKSLGWSLVPNPRALENEWIPVWNQTLIDWVEPLSTDDSRFSVGPQRYLWYNNVEDEDEEEEDEEEEDEEEEDEEEEKEEDEDEDEDEEDEDEDNEDNEDEDEDEDDKDKEVEVLPDPLDDVLFATEITRAAQEASDTGERLLFDSIPDFSTLKVNFYKLRSPSEKPIDPQQEDSKLKWYKTSSRYQHSGGFGIISSPVSVVTELKRAPPRKLCIYQFTGSAWHSFILDLQTRLAYAKKDMVKYTVIYFKTNKQDVFLAQPASGPFWQWLIIHRNDIPWKEPGQEPESETNYDDEINYFLSLFEPKFFELCTCTSDEELTKLRKTYLLRDPADIAREIEQDPKRVAHWEKLRKYREENSSDDLYWLSAKERLQWNEENAREAGVSEGVDEGPEGVNGGVNGGANEVGTNGGANQRNNETGTRRQTRSETKRNRQ